MNRTLKIFIVILSVLLVFIIGLILFFRPSSEMPAETLPKEIPMEENINQDEALELVQKKYPDMECTFTRENEESYLFFVNGSNSRFLCVVNKETTDVQCDKIQSSSSGASAE